MSSLPLPPDQPYVSLKYANVEDFAHELGLSQVQIQQLDFETRNRFQSWLIAGQNNVEAAVSDLSDNDQFKEFSTEFTFARNAVISWAMYKKRQKDGSAAKADHLADYHLQINYLRLNLTKQRTTRAKTASILGKSQKNKNILLPSQLDTAFYNDDSC